MIRRSMQRAARRKGAAAPPATPLTILGDDGNTWWWSFDRDVSHGGDGQPIDDITDQGTNGLVLAATGGTRPTYDADAGDGYPESEYGGSQLLSDAGLLEAISTGDFAIGCVFKAGAAVVGAAFGISDASVDERVWLGKNNTNVQGQWKFTGGAAREILIAGGATYLTAILARRSGEMFMSVNGGSESSSTDNSTGACDADTAMIGAVGLPSASLHLTGEVREAWLRVGTVSSGTVTSLHANMAARWGL